MNHQEAVLLARYVRALCPQQKFDEYTADVWGDVFADYDFESCEQAVVALGQRQSFIAPAEIIAEVRDRRAERMDEFEYELGDPDETAAEYLARRRQQIAAVAAGHRPAALPALPSGNSRPDPEAIGRDIPDDEQPARRRGPLGVDCPRCHARIGQPCKTTFRGRRMADVHPARLDASRSQP